MTQEKAYWLLPRALGKLQYEEVSNTDFTSSARKKRKFDNSLGSTSQEASTSGKKQRSYSEIEPSEEEIYELMKSFSDSGARSVMLSVKSPFNRSFIPTAVRLENDLPVPLTKLKNDKDVGSDIKELKESVQQVKVLITEEQVSLVESVTRQQSKCKLWFEHRAGRITSSNMKKVCSAHLDKPSLSLIQDICYPNKNKLKVPATKWGLDNEETARQSYMHHQSSNHDNLSVNTCGLFISHTHPHIGASPDGIINCTCCGKGCIEIKCPFNLSKGNLWTHPCLNYDPNLGHHLNKSHPYYYQVQTHLFVTRTSYCDFVLWSPNELYIQRIQPNLEFQNDMVSKASNFFQNIVLLELLGCYFSKVKCSKNGKKNVATTVSSK